MVDPSLEATYALTPMQEGMLFHSLYSPSSGVDVIQTVLHLSEELDQARFEAAWQRVVAEHPALRTRFRWEGLEQPVQQVLGRARLPVRWEDWSALSAEEVEERWRELQVGDRHEGFSLSAAPLMRLRVCRLGPAQQRVLWTAHHVVVDVPALVIVLRQVFEVYDAARRGEELALEAGPSFQEYVEWQASQDLSGASAFWRERFEGRPAPARFGVDRGGVPTPAGKAQFDRRSIQIPAALNRQLEGWVREHGLTVHAAIEGAWALVLSRYAGERRIVFGAPRACRWSSMQGAHKLVGMLVNTVPVVVDVNPELAVTEWLAQLREEWLALQAVEHTPLVDIQAGGGGAARSNLFESIFCFDLMDFDAAVRSTGVGWEGRRAESFSEAHYPLTLNVYGGAQPTLRITYDTQRFGSAMVERVLVHLETLLAAMATGEHGRLADLPMLAEAERQLLVEQWGERTSFADGQVPIHRRFEGLASIQPQSVALTCEGQQLTYAELNQRANRLAHLLRARGVGPDVLVGLLLDRGIELVVGILAILKAGGAYVPLDLSIPEERLAFVLDDTQLGLVVTESAQLERLAARSTEHLCVDREEERLAQQPGDDPPSDLSPRNAAYVIYTSGSTGRPKGVVVEHGNLARLFPATQAQFRFDAADVWTLFHSCAFDFSVWELWGALAHGGRLVVVPYWVSREPAAFHELLVREGVTVLNQTPSAFRQLIAADEVVAQGSSAGSQLGLRLVIFGGEALDPQLLAPWFERYGDQRPQLVNMYGITETTVHVTWRPLSASDLYAAPGTLPASWIGRPLPDLSLYILDAELQPVPIGVPGELFVGGDGVARGYLGRPELTRERFLPDPFRPDPGARLYRTGDLARYLPNRDIEYLGRNDDQVKIRGFRIELGEIEVVLAQHAAVQEAVVLAREERPGEQQLVAYLVAVPGTRPTAEALRAHLKARLPLYMVPAAFEELQALPLTANGKVDRRALPAPRAALPADPAGAPRSATEEAVARICAGVLGLEAVGVDDDFFDLGGHSLLAVRLVSHLRSELGAAIALQELFEQPTVAGLAALVEAAGRGGRAGGDGPPLVPIERAAGGLSPSFSQQRLWFLERLALEGGYHIPFALRLRGELDVAALARSLERLVERHEILRTRFPDSSGSPLQEIGAPRGGLLSVERLPAGGEQERLAAVRRRALAEIARPFQLGAEAPLRFCLWGLSDRDHVLVLVFHHIVFDAWSLAVFHRELGALYREELGGGRAELPDLPVQYADYASWERELLQGERLARQVNYWREQLAGAATLELMTDRARPPVQTFRGAAREVAVSAERTRALQALGREANATLFMTVLAAYGVLMGRYAGQADVVVGSPVSNRSRTELEGLIGCFLNVLSLRLDLGGDPDFRGLLARVRQVVLEAFQYQDLPFDRLVEELDVPRDPSRNPLFQVAFALQNAPDEPLELPGIAGEPFALEQRTTRFDLELHLSETPRGLEGQLIYNADLFDDATIEGLVAHFDFLLEQLVADPGCALSELPALPEADLQRVLGTWNDTRSDYPSERCVHELFEEQVRRAPEAPAVIWSEQGLSYGELDERAECLARRLCALGLAAGAPVAVLAERGPELVVGLLGILKAGGAYVPLDPSFPAPRLAWLLEDTGATVLLAQGELADGLPDYGGLVLHLEDSAAFDDEPLPAAERRTGPDHTAYVIYTSGSTGEPKGVCVPHRAIVRLVRDTDYLDLGPRDRIAQTSTTTFDAATFEIWGALLNGACLVGISKQEALQPATMAAAIRERGISALFVTTALFNQLVAHDPRLFAPLRTLLFGGEAVDPGRVREVLRAGPPEHLLHVYGPTENTTFSTWHEVREVPEGARTVPIGRPIANSTAYILDGDLRPVPVGVCGELYLGGDGLASGYLNAPELTAARFVAHPFAGDPRARLYRTGDRARFRADGAIEFVGRLDEQLKIRGHRIEPGEVEAALLGSPGVREAVVIGREDSPGDKRLVAYAVVGSPEPTPEELRQGLKQRLPDYMVPTAIVLLEALPLNANGKVDRRALPAPADRTVGGELVAARTPTEERIAAVWAELLEVSGVGVRDNFFELGGHSLLAVKVISRLRDEYAVEVPLRVLFEDGTVEALARLVDVLCKARGDSDPVGVDEDWEEIEL